ncbi:MAG: pyridoxamine 5-phosphate oxidase [Verrucomicrobia bacterium]|nr:pyridoxamine 5'-phosphate oxidase family protein [Verrucomicrobiota bacterium]RCL29927.1 MAG: pyridoxamine 5-phosphate oxidase [Verrucomicrobiota bacterium]|tara:strand:- start:1019 stop:1459 length:441 start_codon:yes stop_codon:yes gene_type:complete
MPTSKPFDKEKLPEIAIECMNEAKFPVLATVDDNQPRARPVSPVKTEGFTVYVANLRQYGKTQEIKANPKVELCYISSSHDQVRISGIATVLNDRGEIEEIWKTNPLLRKYLGSSDNPELIIYKILPNDVRFMREWALEYYQVPID